MSAPPRHRADSMMSDFWQLCCDYGRYYQESAFTFWRTLRPATYSMVLFVVWLIGFAMLKSGAKR